MSTMKINPTKSFKLLEFKVIDSEKQKDGEDHEEFEYEKVKKDNKQFMIQMYGVDEKGKSASIIINNFMPFFYVKVGNDWEESKVEALIMLIKTKMSTYYQDSLVSYKLVGGKQTLYGFDNGKKHKFIIIKFSNMRAFYRAKNLWYGKTKTLLENGLQITLGGKKEYVQLYEAHIPPLLRYFHIGEISPSGWITIPNKKKVKKALKTTSCDYEYVVNYKDILSLNTKETPVPYKIASYDIEASSSHGDFPLPVKTYKKLASNIVEVIEKMTDLSKELVENLLERTIYTAFGYDNLDGIELVYPKKEPVKEWLDKTIKQWLVLPIRNVVADESHTIEDAFNQGDSDDEYGSTYCKKKKFNNGNVVDLMQDSKFDRESTINELNISLNCKFPKLE